MTFVGIQGSYIWFDKVAPGSLKVSPGSYKIPLNWEPLLRKVAPSSQPVICSFIKIGQRVSEIVVNIEISVQLIIQSLNSLCCQVIKAIELVMNYEFMRRARKNLYW